MSTPASWSPPGPRAIPSPKPADWSRRGACEIASAISFADLLLGEAGQRHPGRGLTIARRFWPRPLVRRLPTLGLLLLIEARR
jgi:hypothetical protein